MTSSDNVLRRFPLLPHEAAYKEAYLKSTLPLMDSPMNFDQYQTYVEEGICVAPALSHRFRDFSDEYLGYRVSALEELFSGDTVQLVLHGRYSYPLFHNHAFIEIIYVYHGCCTHFVNEKTLTLNQGDLCILAPNTMHALSVTEDDTIVFNLLLSKKNFDQDFLNLLRGGSVLIRFFESFFYEKKNFSPFLVYPTGDDSEMHELFDKMYREAQERCYAYQRRLRLCAESMFIHLIRRYEMMAYMSAEIELDFNNHVVSILGYLSLNYNWATLNDTAEFFGYTPAYLSKMIKKYTGHTYSNIIEEYQMENAQKLLKETNLSITEISHKVGCFDSSHFTKKFKKLFGILPSDFRKNNS